jgi:uncharacterized protein involved in exopolysaccharide biosynthesis
MMNKRRVGGPRSRFGRIAWAILRTRATLGGVVVLGCMGMALAYALLAKDRYEAVATLFVDPSALDAGTLGVRASGLRGTDLDLLRSERVAERVVENEHLIGVPELYGIYLSSIDAGRPPIEALGHFVAREVEAHAGGDGSLVRLTVTASEPQLAARIANAYAQAWGEVGMELHAASIRNSLERAHEDLVALRGRLGEARARHRDDHDLASTDERANAQFAQLSRLATSSLHRTEGAATSPPVGGAELPAARAPLESVSMDAAADAGALKANLVAVSAPPSSRSEGRANPPLSADDEIRLAQQSLDRAEERLARLSSEGVGAPFPVHVLLPARAPETSSKPSAVTCAEVGLGAGLLLALLAMALAERFDRRVRRPSDIAQALGIVVLGSLPAVRAAVPVRRPALRTLRWQRAEAPAS